MKVLSKWGVALLATLLMISLFAVPVFADDATQPAGLDTATIVWIIVGAAVAVAAVVVIVVIVKKKK